MFNKIKSVVNKPNKSSDGGCICDKDGKILFEDQEISDRCVEYIGELYNDQRNEMPEIEPTTGPRILQSEIETSIKLMKIGKAAGEDGVTTGMLKALDDTGLKELTKLCNLIYESGKIPEDLLKSVFVTLPKKPTATKCNE